MEIEAFAGDISSDQQPDGLSFLAELEDDVLQLGIVGLLPAESGDLERA